MSKHEVSVRTGTRLSLHNSIMTIHSHIQLHMPQAIIQCPIEQAIILNNTKSSTSRIKITHFQDKLLHPSNTQVEEKKWSFTTHLNLTCNSQHYFAHQWTLTVMSLDSQSINLWIVLSEAEDLNRDMVRLYSVIEQGFSNKLRTPKYMIIPLINYKGNYISSYKDPLC